MAFPWGPALGGFARGLQEDQESQPHQQQVRQALAMQAMQMEAMKRQQAVQQLAGQANIAQVLKQLAGQAQDDQQPPQPGQPSRPAAAPQFPSPPQTDHPIAPGSFADTMTGVGNLPPPPGAPQGAPMGQGGPMPPSPPASGAAAISRTPPGAMAPYMAPSGAPGQAALMTGLPPPPTPDATARASAKQHTLSPVALFKAVLGDLEKKHPGNPLNADAALAEVEKWDPILKGERADELIALKGDVAAQKAAAEAYKTEAALWKAKLTDERLRALGGVDDQGNLTLAPGTKGALNASQTAAAAVRAAKFNLGGGSGGSGGGGKNATGYTPDALDIAAWNYGLTRQLPYRKGKGGPGDPNTAVTNRWAQIGKDMGMDAGQLAAMPDQYKADARSLYFQTKKLDAISGQLKSFHNNIKTWDELARGVAPSIGGEQAQALAGKLKAMDFSNIKALNEVELRIRQAFNDPSAAAYVIGAMSVAMDYARIMSSQGQSAAQLTEGAREEAIRLIPAGVNDKARAAIVGALDSDASGQVKGLKDQLEETKGRMTGHGGRAKPAGGSSLPSGWSVEVVK